MEKNPYWQSLDELRRRNAGEGQAGSNEFWEELPVGHDSPPQGFSRRGFFQAMGLSAAAASAACQRAPVTKLVPYLETPEELTPGVALHYATTCVACPASCGLLVKTRDGRPIKIEGNPDHPVSKGAVCAVGQAQILSLYDADRAQGPTRAGRPIGWSELDALVTQSLRGSRPPGPTVRIVAPIVLGPSEEAAIAKLLAEVPGARLVRSDPTGERRAIAVAHGLTHGVSRIPTYALDRAKVIASFGADFLGAWISPAVLGRSYTTGRRAHETGSMSRHWQLEPLMTLTGANADRRVPLAASELRPTLGVLFRLLIEHRRDVALPDALRASLPTTSPSADVQALANELLEAGPHGIVLSGSADPAVQALVNLANQLLGAYGTTVDLEAGVPIPESGPDIASLVAELEQGQVAAVIFWRTNPVYSNPLGPELRKAIAKSALSVAIGDRIDETASVCQLHAAEHDPLESWGDSRPNSDILGLRQPLVRPLYDTRAGAEVLARWSGSEAPYEATIRSRGIGALQVGFTKIEAEPLAPPRMDADGLASLLARETAPTKETELVLYQTPNLREGEWANNGWLQELPDPVTKVTWGNYVSVSPDRAVRMAIADGDLVRVTVEALSIDLPVLVQPGQHPRVIAIALGYGRTKSGRIGDDVGANAYPLGPKGPGLSLVPRSASLQRLVGSRPLAMTQRHASLEGRPHVRETTLSQLSAPSARKRDGEGGSHKHLSLWPGHTYSGARWGMAIDLSACTGCSACVVSCQAENNIPIVGADDVRRQREMHWMRIDRYYAGPAENPRTLHQPMLCQHCENAPCETVCPVLATVHSREGLNQQVYNRCVGTRYCANNCPVKVRRFNWFDYTPKDPMERMVLNPDVVVRSRGVMEKCSMCVHRIHEAKALAKIQGRTLKDGDIQPACAQSCPAQAIVFGDLNDPKSRIAELAKAEGSYTLLPELNLGPVIHYRERVRNGAPSDLGSPDTREGEHE